MPSSLACRSARSRWILASRSFRAASRFSRSCRACGGVRPRQAAGAWPCAFRKLPRGSTASGWRQGQPWRRRARRCCATHTAYRRTPPAARRAPSDAAHVPRAGARGARGGRQRKVGGKSAAGGARGHRTDSAAACGPARRSASGGAKPKADAAAAPHSTAKTWLRAIRKPVIAKKFVGVT